MSNKERRKRKFHFSSTLVLICLLCAVVFFPACGDPLIGAKGTVRDESGVPLENVSIILERNGGTPRERTTAKDGSFDVYVIGGVPKETRMTFKKEGYKTFVKQFETEGKQETDVMLERESR